MTAVSSLPIVQSARLPAALKGRLRMPVVAAPMFLISGPELVIACCKAGIVGSFPALNPRTTEELDAWLTRVNAALGPDDAPFAVNLIVHKSNPRLAEDLKVLAKHRVPIVITSLGAVVDVVDAVHAYGGVVFHDIIGRRHAEKAAQAGVDGLILVAAGAGGHAGTVSPFALLSEAREVFDGPLLLAGALSTGAHLAAARAMGADLCYMGTRFIATEECAADAAYKDMVTQARAQDIVYTPAVSGVAANFLRQSLEAAGLDPKALPEDRKLDFAEKSEARAWKTIWSAGHGVGAIQDAPSVAVLVERLEREYRAALGGLCGG